MSASLQVVALISGGKDSLFSLLHCLQNGHRVVALANLHPPAGPTHPNHDASGSASVPKDDEEQDMNSFMYQTVGHQVIPWYADALGLPIYRREIQGSAVQAGRYYDTSEPRLRVDDETEDLFQLLQEVLGNHPEVNAVSSGAILSTYQRTRVDSIAIRLGLTPLAYLWQYPALPPPSARLDSLTGLLDDMAAAGCDARIIKIATGGMKETMLWSNVADPRTRSRLVAGMTPFYTGHEFWLRGAVLGEGGEYETLAADGPHPLWKKRLVFDHDQITTVTGEGGVYHTRLGGVATAEKEPESGQDEALVRVPELLDAQFIAVQSRVVSRTDDDDLAITNTTVSQSPTVFRPRQLPKAVMNISPADIILSNVIADDTGHDAASQMSQIVMQVKTYLSSVDPFTSTSHAVSALLLLSDMSDFVIVNPVYASLFLSGEPNPPARVTVAVDLPPHVKVSVSLVVSRSQRSQLRGLHVQSRSYWAPANIGPYSQAVSEPLAIDTEHSNVHDAARLEAVHVAGQIPLVPQSMEVLAGTFQEQGVLSLQHLWRIGQERGVDVWPWGVAFLPSTDHANVHAEAAYRVWFHAHIAASRTSDSGNSSEDEQDQDVWFAQHDLFSANGRTANATTCGDHLHLLPNDAVVDWSASVNPRCPPFLAVEVVSLPRDAPIEWWSLGIANIASPSSGASFTSRSFSWGAVANLVVAARHEEDSWAPSRVSFVSIVFSAGATAGNLPSFDRIMDDMELVDKPNMRQSSSVHATLFLSAQGSLQATEVLSSLGLDSAPAIVPCRRLWGSVSAADTDADLYGRPLQSVDAAVLLRLDG